MKDLCYRLADLTSTRDAARRLVDVSNTTRLEAARKGAIKGVPVVGQDAIYGLVPSTNGTKVYRPHITHHEARGWRCTCPDAGYRGERVGPCKHAIVLALAVIEAAQAEINTITEVIAGS